jgi:hypothetical protein
MDLNIKELAQGIINDTKRKFGNPNPSVEQLAEKRLEVCLSPCTEMYEDSLGKRCGLCNCVLAWMSRSDKKCKAGKWDNL